MKLSPLDLRHHDFRTTMRGYDKAQVQDILEMAADSLETLSREVQQLRQELSRRDEALDELREGESELRRAVISAERLGTELKEQAQREAERIVQDAKLRRERMLQETELELSNLKADYARTEREHRLFREQFKGMLRAYAHTLEDEALLESTQPSTLRDLQKTS